MCTITSITFVKDTWRVWKTRLIGFSYRKKSKSTFVFLNAKSDSETLCRVKSNQSGTRGGTNDKCDDQQANEEEPELFLLTLSWTSESRCCHHVSFLACDAVNASLEKVIICTAQGVNWSQLVSRGEVWHCQVVTDQDDVSVLVTFTQRSDSGPKTIVCLVGD